MTFALFERAVECGVLDGRSGHRSAYRDREVLHRTQARAPARNDKEEAAPEFDELISRFRLDPAALS